MSFIEAKLLSPVTHNITIKLHYRKNEDHEGVALGDDVRG
jgi:hypothetical protein